MNTPSPDKPHHHGNLRQALIDFACTAAQSGTLDQLSIRQASREIGVSPGAAYRHFADRDDLLRAVADRGFDLLAAQFETAAPFASAATSADDALGRFRALAGVYVDFARDHYGLWRLMFGPHGLRPGTRTPDRPATYDFLGKALAELGAHGLIAPPSAQGQFFAWTAIHGFADLQASPAVTTRAGTALDDQCRAILAALKTGAAR